jgi:hypothetical protein
MVFLAQRPSPSFSFGAPKEKVAKRKTPFGPIAPRGQKLALRCWEELDLAVWRWIFVRCILSIGLIAAIVFSY